MEFAHGGLIVAPLSWLSSSSLSLFLSSYGSKGRFLLVINRGYSFSKSCYSSSQSRSFFLFHFFFILFVIVSYFCSFGFISTSFPYTYIRLTGHCFPAYQIRPTNFHKQQYYTYSQLYTFLLLFTSSLYRNMKIGVLHIYFRIYKRLVKISLSQRFLYLIYLVFIYKGEETVLFSRINITISYSFIYSLAYINN